MVVTEQDGFRPKISIVAAVAANGVIGVDNRLPWRLPADMRRFRELTLGKPVIMGRRTYESIGRPLAKRTNIVLTRNLNFEADGCIVVHSAEAAIAAAGDARELMVIGAFETWLPPTDRFYLTQIAAEFEGDTFFPDADPAEWQVVSAETFSPDATNLYPYRFVTLDRIRS
ncbi:MAG: dihydrofolate reductase [Anaerolineae bacterium]|nr:dihydrofolate reductase [Anaerolineae bacterium]